MQHLAARHATASSDGKLSNSSNGVPSLQPTPHMQVHQKMSSRIVEGNAHLNVLHAHGSMQHPKSQEAAKVLRHEHSIEAHNRDAGRLDGTNNDEGGVSHVQPAVHATQKDAC